MQKNFAQTDYAATARQAAAEGAVLLRYHRHALPLEKGCCVAVFGRNQLHYYRCGIGSGGMVNSAYVISILDALKADSDIVLNQAVLSAYEAWHETHPLEGCNEWGEEPWSQAEMPLPEALVQQAAKTSDAALICIGRTAGEDHDSSAAPGSFLLTEEEENTICLVCRYFPRSIVVLNTAGIIDMSWVKRCNPAAILYVWHGGQEGGNGAADVLTGRVNPCGKLPDTIAEQLSDYPANANFGNAERNFYAEDIFLGYRYFETFAPEKVLYPFGFGLSYTTFSMKMMDFLEMADAVTVTVSVRNTGDCAGKEVVQLYCEAPQGMLGKPARTLCAFAKTKLLAAGEEQLLTLTVRKDELASYDDSGVTGHPFCEVLEAGTYRFFLGGDVRSAGEIGTFTLMETQVTGTANTGISARCPLPAHEKLRRQADVGGRAAAEVRFAAARAGAFAGKSSDDGKSWIPPVRRGRRQNQHGGFRCANGRKHALHAGTRRRHVLTQGNAGNSRCVRRTQPEAASTGHPGNLLCGRAERHSHGLRHTGVSAAERHLSGVYLQ